MRELRASRRRGARTTLKLTRAPRHLYKLSKHESYEICTKIRHILRRRVQRHVRQLLMRILTDKFIID